MYFSFSPFDVTFDDIAERIVRCIADIQHWMDTNFLKLNDDQTEAIFFGSSHHLKKVSVESIPVGDVFIIPSSRVKNLQALCMQDSSMTMMAAHIGRVCSAARLHFRNISRIRPFLSQTITEQLVHAFAISRIDMGNAALSGVTEAQLSRLQRVQNCAAGLGSRNNRAEHITPVLEQLHWVPVKQRVIFKILLQVCRPRNNSAPGYIRELLHARAPTRSLRSNSEGLQLAFPRTRTAWGGCGFAKTGPQL